VIYLKTITLSANTSWYLFNFRKSTILRFIEEGYRVICISPKDEYSKDLKELGCDYIELNMSNKGINPFKDLKIIFSLLIIYLKFRPEASFHFTIKNNIYGTWAAFISRTPAINNISGLGTAFIRDGLVSKIVRILYKISQPLAKRVYCQNKEDYEFLIKKGLVSEKKLFLLPGSGVDLKRFNPQLINDHNKLFSFLYVGRIIADKGIIELIKAIENINCNKIVCTLKICGFLNADNVSVISIEDIEKWKEVPGVELIEPTNRVENIMKESDCIVLPSYREGMPRSLLEAGAMGLPSITTDVPGCRNIIQDKINGLLCNARDSASLELAMNNILYMPKNERLKMGKNARKIVEDNFDEKIVINAALDALNSL
jgi:glycosyltransferase involved in cell wall biosynthesis|tara:strand:- start:14478 stop:15593 length:1116 start_codon:yes stop_codon:yes gene_type:complete